jgi:hypothetical protein
MRTLTLSVLVAGGGLPCHGFFSSQATEFVELGGNFIRVDEGVYTPSFTVRACVGRAAAN